MVIRSLQGSFCLWLNAFWGQQRIVYSEGQRKWTHLCVEALAMKSICFKVAKSSTQITWIIKTQKRAQKNRFEGLELHPVYNLHPLKLLKQHWWLGLSNGGRLKGAHGRKNKQFETTLTWKIDETWYQYGIEYWMKLNMTWKIHKTFSWWCDINVHIPKVISFQSYNSGWCSGPHGLIHQVMKSAAESRPHLL